MGFCGNVEYASVLYELHDRSVVFWFLGVCYAEFAGRVPKAGSAYIYSYVAVGEFIAFVIGWNLLLEHTIGKSLNYLSVLLVVKTQWLTYGTEIFIDFFLGTAAVAKAMSNYLDSLLGDPQKNYMKTHFPIDVEYLGEYPDVASFVFIMLIACN